MGGWTAAGFRVYLGAAVSYEEIWKRYYDNLAEGQVFRVAKARRQVDQERAEWRGLTRSGADTKNPSAGWHIVERSRQGESGEWRVTEETTTYGEWEEVTDA